MGWLVSQVNGYALTIVVAFVYLVITENMWLIRNDLVRWIVKAVWFVVSLWAILFFTNGLLLPLIFVVVALIHEVYVMFAQSAV